MSVQNNNDDQIECPLCMEPLEMDDINFFPCTCGYQICRFCWHRIRTDENGLCPACRKPYPENPADFKPLSQEELQLIKQEKRQKDLLRKQKVTENRKHLANVRVVQKNLVFVVGLSARLAEIETLKKVEYFGKFGKIHKVVINHSTAYAGSQGPSASAYVTYQRAEDALRAIQAVNNIYVDGRTLKASLGTTKYCSHFMKNQQCPKADCMYLHELGDEAASFTKEEMQQGKHQDFEKQLQEQYLGNSGPTEKANGLPSLVNNLSSLMPVNIQIGNTIPNNTSKKAKNGDGSKTVIEVLNSNVREGWPPLSASPSSSKESKKTKKSERNSARQTPTEDQNKRNEKKEKKINNKEKCNINNENRNTPSILGSQDSGNSSASATPPPLPQSEVSSHSNFFKASSPLPVHNIKSALQYDPESNSSPLQVHNIKSTLQYDPENNSSRLPVHNIKPALQYEPENNSSPIATTPSSLSSCSEPSSSLQNASISSEPLKSITSSHYDTNGFLSDIQISENNPPVTRNISIVIRDHVESKTSPIPANLPNGEHPMNLELLKLLDPQSSTDPVPLWDHLGYINDIEDLSVIERQLDDELGFDPFEETNKALAEDIIKEQNIIEQQRQSQLQQIQNKYVQPIHQKQVIPPTIQVFQPNIKNLLEFGPQAKDLLQTRLPPPGFNGMIGGAFSVPQQQSHLHKIPQPYMGGMNSNQNMTNTNNSPQQLNGYIGSNKIGVPPGLANNILNGPSLNSLHGLVANGLPAHQMNAQSLVTGFEQSFGGTTFVQSNNKPETFVLKDMDTSLNNIRNITPIMNSVSNMNSVNNSLTTGNDAHTQAHISSQNPITNLLNFTHQQHTFSSPQNLLHRLGPGTISAHNKGWKNTGANDLTVLDPAIVLSGQVTESPPQWINSVEQLGTEGNCWPNIIPSNIISGPLPGTFNGIPQSQTQQRASIWPPTSPPPGFNSIPTYVKQREAHKIENL